MKRNAKKKTKKEKKRNYLRPYTTVNRRFKYWRCVDKACDPISRELINNKTIHDSILQGTSSWLLVEQQFFVFSKSITQCRLKYTSIDL